MSISDMRKKIIGLCMSFPDAYEDYPFNDSNWTVMRHGHNKKIFACIYERMGNIWINVKCEPAKGEFLRKMHRNVVPAYHMNKTHWNSIIMDGTASYEAVCAMIDDSYKLTAPKIQKTAL